MSTGKTCRPVPGLSREAEEQELKKIIHTAQENLTKTEAYIRQLTDELDGLMETYGTKDKEAMTLFHNTHSQIQEHKRALLRCQKARHKPYFGRIDFKDPKQPQTESYYVGRVGIAGSDAQPLVIDWRAPVASVYYENALGTCTYTVKNEGSFAIDLKRKRTYEIEKDRLKDFYDSDVVANDELLTQYLAKSKKAVLGEIIATIQKEQNAIIRQSPKTNLIVQGVAGSGKTTVAMHRISYILYNYEEQFRPQDFYIIGSNRILLNYITSVLPDLDVYGVSQMTMEELFTRLLYEDWDPLRHRACAIDKKQAGASVKGSFAWFHDLEQFCAAYEQETIPKSEVRIQKNGVLLLAADEICSYFETVPQLSMQCRINMLNKILLSRLENELSGKHVSYTAAEKKELRRTYRWHFGKDVWKGSVFEVYGQFLQAQKEAGKVVPYTEDAFDVYDLAALAYMYKRIKETDSVREATHIIIDEAQDFGMMAYGALAYCLRGCTYTIMGDVSQNIHFGYGLNDWGELQKLILTGTYDRFGLLKKSYRNTVEISHFATEILRHGNFPIYPVEPINRHGAAVQVTAYSSEESMIQETIQKIAGWQKAGRETIAVICKDEAEAAMVRAKLSKMTDAMTEPVESSLDLKKLEMIDASPDTAEFGNGVMVLPVEYTKGLEFDAVLLYDPSREKYPAQDAYVKLLYVAATRALHELAVVHLGCLTELIAKPVSEEKRMKSLEQEAHHKEAKRYQKKEMTAREEELLKASQGEKERTARAVFGPKPIVVKTATPSRTRHEKTAAMPAQGELQKPARIPAFRTKPAGNPGKNLNMQPGGKPTQPAGGCAVPINPSSYRFGECPDSSRLRPKGHSRIDNAVCMVKKTNTGADLISSYGTLRLTPIEDALIRVQFQKGAAADFEPGYWDCKPKAAAFWKIKEQRGMVELATKKLVVHVDKKTGAVQFLDPHGKLLLAETADLPRQVETADTKESWVYFDWQKNEKLFAKGILSDDLESINRKARYISFGGKRMRMPLLVSANGYGIGAAAGVTAMCCTIPMYGSYLYTGGSGQIDYYFLYGENQEAVLELYQRIS
ncbi:MAG: DUF4968 domain-containing protein [Eubacterium sp.]|nr:DUF4968 domain-containing protein [Eubacterium sp.]